MGPGGMGGPARLGTLMQTPSIGTAPLDLSDLDKEEDLIFKNTMSS